VSDDRAILGGILRSLGGVCRICECTGDSCRLREGGDERCVWVDRFRTLCSNPDCIREAARRKKRHKLDARRKRWQRGRAA
jgi:hypothetical protein